MLQQLPAPETDKCRFTFPAGDHGGEQYELSLSACPNPVCTCGTISVQMSPDTTGAAAATIPEAKFLLDVYAQALDPQDTTSRRADKAVGALLVDHLAEADWTTLKRLFVEEKRSLTAQANDRDLQVYFPAIEIERDSLMIDFHKILPFAETTIVESGDKRFELVEHYCIKTKCGCSDICVTLMGADGIREGLSSDQEPVLFVDYKTQSWRIEVPGAEDPEVVKHIGERLCTGEYARRFEGRHDRLKSLYGLFKQRQHVGSTKVREVPKVGRNDPCPCGSGKKYKKCCLGADRH
jgi:hypothetical protein